MLVVAQQQQSGSVIYNVCLVLQEGMAALAQMRGRYDLLAELLQPQRVRLCALLLQLMFEASLESSKVMLNVHFD